MILLKYTFFLCSLNIKDIENHEFDLIQEKSLEY